MNITDLKNIKEDIINEYVNQNVSADELCNKYSARWTDIYDIISKTFPTGKNCVPEDKYDEIKNMYLSGMSCTRIGEKLHIYHKPINDVLEKLGVKRDGRSRRQYYLNENYFDNIDTPNKAYILGFFFADGCNFMKKSTISMSLEKHDKEILEKIRKEIRSERPLEFIQQSKRIDKNDYHYKDMWRLLLFSSHMCKALNDVGMVPNKSLILKFPENLNKNLYSHFMRGYFDGDGSYCHHITSKGWRQDLITFTSTLDMCEHMLNILHDGIVTGGGIYDASNKNGVTKVLSISGTNQCKVIFDYMYKDADLYMKRKHDLYLKWFCN